MSLWHSFRYKPGSIPCSYVRAQYCNGDLLREDTDTVFVACLSDFAKLLDLWNKLGSIKSELNGFHYRYTRG